MGQLKDKNAKNTYNETMKKKLGQNREETIDADKVWEQQRKAYVESAEEVLGFRKGKSKP